MLLQDEQNVLRWLSEYGALPRAQVTGFLKKPNKTAEKILQNLKRAQLITERGGYLASDGMAKPDHRMERAVWVLLQFIDKVDERAHYPAVYPSQVFFLKENAEYEIVVLYEGEEHLLRLLRPQEDLKYIIVLPFAAMIQRLRKPPAPCIFATVEYCGERTPRVTFYAEGAGENG